MYAREAPRSGELAESFETHQHAMTALEKSSFSGEGEPDYNTLLSDSFMADLWKDTTDLPLERGATFDGASPCAKHAGSAAAAGAPVSTVVHGPPAAQATAQFTAAQEAGGHMGQSALQAAGGSAAVGHAAAAAPAMVPAGAAATRYVVADVQQSGGGSAFGAQHSSHLPPEQSYTPAQPAQPSVAGLQAPYGACDAEATLFTEMPTPASCLQQPAGALPGNAMAAAPLAGTAGGDASAAVTHMARLGSGGGAPRTPPSMAAAPQQPSPQRVDSGALRRTESGAAAPSADAAAAHGLGLSVAPRSAAADPAFGASGDAAAGALGESPEPAGGDDARGDAEDGERADKKSTVTTVQARAPLSQRPKVVALLATVVPVATTVARVTSACATSSHARPGSTGLTAHAPIWAEP